MMVTSEMLEAAMKKAVEAGLLPRHARSEDVSINQDLIRIVLQAAFDVSQSGQIRAVHAVRAEAGHAPMSVRRRLVQMSRGADSGNYAQ